jgi:hypothetical protein
MIRWGWSAPGILLLLLLVALPASSKAASRARDQGPAGPALLIAADRVTGFVPFTVTVYGKVRGVEPGTIELCRQRITPLFEPLLDRPPTRPGPESETWTDPAEPAACVAGRAVPSAGGFSYEHDLRFDEAGHYHVRLTMVDTSGRRLTSNTVRVSAF